jgi:hypothetical protein
MSVVRDFLGRLLPASRITIRGTLLPRYSPFLDGHIVCGPRSSLENATIHVLAHASAHAAHATAKTRHATGAKPAARRVRCVQVENAQAGEHLADLPMCVRWLTDNQPSRCRASVDAFFVPAVRLDQFLDHLQQLFVSKQGRSGPAARAKPEGR